MFTDYKHPEKVVERIKQASQRLGGRLVAAVFSQRFNATNAKRDGMQYLRDQGVHCIAPRIKSLGSALEAVKTAMRQYLGESD